MYSQRCWHAHLSELVCFLLLHGSLWCTCACCNVLRLGTAEPDLCCRLPSQCCQAARECWKVPAVHAQGSRPSQSTRQQHRAAWRSLWHTHMLWQRPDCQEAAKVQPTRPDSRGECYSIKQDMAAAIPTPERCMCQQPPLAAAPGAGRYLHVQTPHISIHSGAGSPQMQCAPVHLLDEPQYGPQSLPLYSARQVRAVRDALHK